MMLKLIFFLVKIYRNVAVEFKFPQNQFQKTGRKPINKAIEANKILKIAKKQCNIISNMV